MEMVKQFREMLIDVTGSPCGSIYYNLFSLMTDKELEILLKNYRETFSKNREDWFFLFHKALRQSDCFNIEGYRIVSNPNDEGKMTKSKEYVSVGGKLDSILWDTIHLDKENILMDLMERVFVLSSLQRNQ